MAIKLWVAFVAIAFCGQWAPASYGQTLTAFSVIAPPSTTDIVLTTSNVTASGGLLPVPTSAASTPDPTAVYNSTPTPAVSTPAISTPTVSIPAISTPVSISTVSTTVYTLVVSTPAISTSAISTPAVSTPAISTPAISTPAVSTSAISTSAISTSAVSTPAVSTSAISTSAVSTSAVSTSAISTPASFTSAISTPTVSTSAISTSAISTPAISTPAISISASAPPTSFVATSSVVASTSSPSTEPPNNAAIIGGVVGGSLAFILCLLVLVIVFAVLGRSRSGKIILENESRASPSSPAIELTQLQPVNARLQPIPIADFPAHVKSLHEGANRGFEEEFTSISTAPLGPYEISCLPYNVPRNRFENIYPYDSSRVMLSAIPGVEGSDYINASYVDGCGKQNCYVATQGPLPNTIADFWRMVWEQRYPTIVMLTELMEGGKLKCERYWPQNVNECWDVGHNLRVTLLEQKPFVEYRLKVLTVTNTASPSSTPLRINHYHFTVWPDHGVPADKTCMIQFIKRVRNVHPYSDPAPLVVHCSAGVGRTGTFILLDSMLERMKTETTLNVYQMVCSIRKKRPLLVQADVQYMFIHDALDEYITCGDTSIPVNKMADTISQLKEPKAGSTAGFKNLFKLLGDVSQSPAPHSFTEGEAEYNVSKNRYQDRLPLNNTRVRLRTKGAKGTDYINATYVDGYKLPKACIATQAPLEATADDFWRMVTEVQSRVIVMLCNLKENDKDTSYRYWPEAVGKMLEFGKLKVKLINEEETEDDYTLRKLELSSDSRSSMSGGTDSSIVWQFHYTRWPEEGKPSSNTSILKIMEALIKVQITTGNRAIIVMCNDGIGRTGAFICTYAQLERIKTEAVSDVFQFIKSSRLQRPGMVTHLDHYMFCHEVLDSYVQSFGNYSNFQ